MTGTWGNGSSAMRPWRALLSTCLCAVALHAAAAPASAQRAIPLRKLTPQFVTDSGVLQGISGVRQLPDGRVLVNDPSGQRLLALNSTLTKFTVILDTAGGNGGSKYGGQPGGLFPFLGDSSLFLDGDARVFVVIDPGAKVVRTMAAPKTRDAMYLLAFEFPGTPGVDSRGRIIYTGFRPAPAGSPATADAAAPQSVYFLPDSAPILRGDFDARTVDTIAMLRIPTRKMVMTTLKSGMRLGVPAVNPVPATDEWTLLADGTVAIVRGYDYHIDWLHPDGTRTSSSKMPFDWRRITLEEKDSLLAALVKADADRKAKAPPRPPALPGEPERLVVPFMTVDARDLPDFYPPIRAGTVKADQDGNVWILPTTSTLATGGLVYDVVNRAGEVFERVQLPEGRDIAGFGRGGVVYLRHSPGAGLVFLERAMRR